MIVGILLILLGMCLIIAEVMIPSGGIISILAVASLIGAFIFGFQEGVIEGVILIGSTVFLLPIVLSLTFKFFPKTPIGRKMIGADDFQQDSTRQAVAHEEKTLVGQIGATKTVLRPAGIIEIAGESFDAVSEGDVIEIDKTIQVVEVSGNRIIVRAIENS